MERDDASRTKRGLEDDSRNNEDNQRYSVGDTYRWECPICGLASVTTVRDPAQALRTHVFITRGDGHGEPASFPEDFPEDSALDDFITRID